MPLEIPPSSPIRYEAEEAKLNVAGYLEHRNKAQKFIIVEIGHREQPIAPLQANLTGQKAYIGIEANLRDPLNTVRPKIAQLRKKMADQNVIFVDQRLDGEAYRPERDWEEGRSSTAFHGDYQPTTIMPDGGADEVFLGNVFGDPHVSHYKKHTERLLDEVSRIVSRGGKIIIRETITPEHCYSLDRALRESSLKEVAYIEPGSAEWDMMEESFNGAQDSFRNHGSFYLVLEK